MIASLCCYLAFKPESRVARAYVHALQTALVRGTYGSKDFDRILRETTDRFQVGEGQDEREVGWQRVYGTSPAAIARVLVRIPNPPYDADFAEINLILWPTTKGTQVQSLGTFAESNKGPTFFVDGEAYRRGDRLIRCGAASHAGNRNWPAVRIYRLQKGRWRVVNQYDFEDRFGSAHFLKKNGRVDPTRIIAETWSSPQHLSAPMSGPNLDYEQTWLIAGDRIKPARVKLLETDYEELDRLAGVVQNRRRREFNASVSEPYQERLWRLMQEYHDFTNRTESGDYDSRPNTFTVRDFDGHRKGTVKLARRNGHWRVVSVT